MHNSSDKDTKHSAPTAAQSGDNTAQQQPDQSQKKKNTKPKFRFFRSRKVTDSAQPLEPSSVKLKTVRSDANPIWLKPMMFGFLILGLLWILVFYLTSGRIPVYELGNWNLLVGIGISMIGFFMMTSWK